MNNRNQYINISLKYIDKYPLLDASELLLLGLISSLGCAFYSTKLMTRIARLSDRRTRDKIRNLVEIGLLYEREYGLPMVSAVKRPKLYVSKYDSNFNVRTPDEINGLFRQGEALLEDYKNKLINKYSDYNLDYELAQIQGF